MSSNVFEIIDKSKRRIRLTKKQWTHIITKHSYMVNYLADVEETIKNPVKIVPHDFGNLFDYYRYYKNRKNKLKFLKAVVKYLNGEGFILSSYFVTHIN